MKAEQVKTLTTEAIEKLAKALEAGKSEALTAFLTAAARFHRYSFRNVMLIATQRPDATHVAGFNAWKSLGRFVKKGEKGIVIVAPVPLKPRETDTAEDRESGIRFKAAYVFDITQTDGESLPELSEVNGDPGVYTERLKAVVTARGIVLDYSEELGTADGRSKGGRIELKPSLSPAHEFEVLAHELAHEMLHHQGERRPRRIEELEAEAVAFVVSQGIGLESQAAVDYIQLYDGTKEALAASLERIQETARTILHSLFESSEDAEPDATPPAHDQPSAC